MQDIDDKAALKLMRAGHEIGVEILFKRYFPKLRRMLINKYNVPSQLADQICQEVFFDDFYNDPNKSREIKSVKAWLYTLTRNRALNSIKQEKTSHPPKKSGEEDEQGEIETLEKEYEQEEKILCYARCIGEAVKKLYKNDADCFEELIFYLQKLSIEENIPINFKQIEKILKRCKRPNCLIALMLFYGMDLLQQEVADILGKKPNTLGVFIHDCKRRLRDNTDLESCYKKCKDTEK